MQRRVQTNRRARWPKVWIRLHAPAVSRPEAPGFWFRQQDALNLPGVKLVGHQTGGQDVQQATVASAKAMHLTPQRASSARRQGLNAPQESSCA